MKWSEIICLFDIQKEAIKFVATKKELSLHFVANYYQIYYYYLQSKLKPNTFTTTKLQICVAFTWKLLALIHSSVLFVSNRNQEYNLLSQFKLNLLSALLNVFIFVCLFGLSICLCCAILVSICYSQSSVFVVELASRYCVYIRQEERVNISSRQYKHSDMITNSITKIRKEEKSLNFFFLFHWQ